MQLRIFLILSLVVLALSITYPNGNISFQAVNDKEFSVTITGKPSTWVGIGFGSSMLNVDMHIIEFGSDGTYNLYDRYSTGHAIPKDDSTLGGKDDLTNASLKLDSNSNPTIQYKRMLNTGDKYDAVITLNTKQNLIVAWGVGTLSYHGQNKKLSSFVINYADPNSGNPNNNTTDTTPNNDTNENDGNTFVSDLAFWDFHGVTMILLWSGINFISYITIRFWRHKSYTIWIHRVCAGLTVNFTIGIGIAAFVKASDISEFSPVYMSLHYNFAIVFFSLSVLQYILGVTASILIYEKPGYTTDWLHRFKLVHKFNGILLTFTVYIQLVTGFYMKYPHVVEVPYIFCGFFLTVIIILEIINLVHMIKTQSKDINTTINSLDRNLTNMTMSDLETEKNAKIRKYVLYENFVCDVTKFTWHPGGKNLIQDNLYNDVTRYMTGNQAFNKNYSPVNHKLLTHKFIINELAYARIIDEACIVKKGNKSYTLGEEKLKLISNRKVAQRTSQLTFSVYDPKDHQTEIELGINDALSSNKISFAKLLPGVSWIGRHYSITSLNLNRTRFYSISLSMDEVIKQQHIDLLNRLNENEKEAISPIAIAEEDQNSKEMKVYIKAYQGKCALSQYLTNLEPTLQGDLVIRGPCGVGLNLFENKLRGAHVIFAAGTGVIPFLDLVSFTLRYAVYKIKNSKDLLPGEEFDQIVERDYQLHYFANFNNEESALYHDVCEKLSAVDLHHNLNIFKYYVRFSNKQPRWSREFYEKNLQGLKDSINKVYIVGPIAFIDDVKETMISTKIADSSKLVFV